MVDVKSTSSIIPSKPAPGGVLRLSECDQRMQWTHIPLIFIYKATGNNNEKTKTVETLKDSLSRVFVPYYPLAVQLLEAYSEAKLDELGDFAPMKAIEDLVPKPLLLVQVTRFSCGGLCVATVMSHTMVDGWSAAKFFNVWAKVHQTTLRLGDTDAKEEKKKETYVAILKVTKEQVEGLRKKANETPCQDVDMVSTRPYSRYEAIASHLWRCTCKARANDNSQPTRVTLAIDFRCRLKPPEYFGNTVLQTVTSKCVHGDLLAKPLSYAAGKLREAIERMTDEYIRSALDFIASQKDLTAMGHNIETGNPNTSILSWINLPFYGMDFGWGKPIYVGPALLNDDDGKTYIMSSPDADGSLIIALRL
ncbi:hypothetical protein I3842_10G134700 [Carya illinoinensis]|uniref:Uncharacterized protein n=1 Tax=Carya illinoinensis TaxID=32201 RepID=A0A922DXZ3_CARIL|nr:hypothetical protein I3842_10G134700 [Carya illinoinensis]